MIKALLDRAAGADADAASIRRPRATTRRGWRLLEEAKTLPFGAVWDHYCETREVPVGPAWIDAIKGYETEVLAKRS